MRFVETWRSSGWTGYFGTRARRAGIAGSGLKESAGCRCAKDALPEFMEALLCSIVFGSDRQRVNMDPKRVIELI